MIPRLAALALALTAAGALAETSPKPAERPILANPSAPRNSPQPTARRAAGVDYQGILAAAVDSPEARVMIRERATGAADDLPVHYFLSIPPEALDPEVYELLLVDPGAGVAVTLPHGDFEAFSRAHPEFGQTATAANGGGWMPVRRAFFDDHGSPPEAGYFVILVAGRGLAGDPRMVSAGAALCDQPEFTEAENLAPDRLALVAAPVEGRRGEDEEIRLAEDYSYERAAYWLDTLSGTALGREAGARLDSGAFGFIAAATDPTRALETARPEEFDAVDAIYIDLAAISPGYVEEVVGRIVRGMHEGNAVSHTGAIGVLEAFSLVERIGAATLEIAGLLEPSAARAAPKDEGC